MASGARPRTGSPGLEPLVIVGAGGFGRELLELVDEINAVKPTWDFRGFLDDGVVKGHLLERLGATLIGPTARLADFRAHHVVAIAAPDVRRRIDQDAQAWQSPAATLRHPSVTSGRDVEIAAGVVLAAGVRLSTHITIGRNAHLNVNTTVGHDVEIGEYATLFPGVHVSGSCVIEEGATLGTGTILLPGIRVGRGATVGAGATVVRDVAPYSTVVAIPARPSIGAHRDAAPDG